MTHHGEPVTPRPSGAPAPSPSRSLTSNGDGRLLTAEDLAERWSVSKGHVYRLSRDGALPTVRIGRYCRYRLAAVERFEEAGGCGVPND